ncbi:glutamate--tRNA ligase [Sulfurospirillum multivorans]|uniref:Glutamate--tRNA ligase n=2 Tax=Sulfurospirillum multivorans TaxID=66821 RepID=A0AA86E0Z8_SULMK|nr:glutamate--tRNA ligase [Sulfurospirillum multivorans]AHJ14385.1 glutamate--tRNA ligase [Sulfurospirillum multivorans DSM 12446]QEH07870.1 glutamate--tRNA ligase [Sulfurospirillum multivorans]
MIVTRFAPSPTGYLHIGGLRTALYSYLWAKRNSGKFLFRIEDTDLARNSKEAADAIVEAFKWVGLAHEGEIVYQSERFDLYKSYVQKLLDAGKAYKCYMSKEDLDALREAQSARKERPHYDGRYRDFTGTPPEGVEPVIRIKAPTSGVVSFVDGVKGEVTFNASDMLDDFIIARSDGTPTYNFVVVIDDALMGVNEVIRGDDHLSNTPKQIILYEALSFDIPKFYHVPMILNPQGKKLSKRDGAVDVMDYKREGYLPEALLNFLIRLGWSHGDQEIFSFEQMQALFDPSHINKSASAYNQEKLVWLNAHYIKQASYERLIEELRFFDVDISLHVKKALLIDALRDRAKTLVEFASLVKQILEAPTCYDEKAVEKFLTADGLGVLEQYLVALKGEKSLLLASEFETFTKAFLEERGLKLKDLAQAIRIAMVGSSVSPSIFDVLEIIGYEDVVKRIETLILFQRSSGES